MRIDGKMVGWKKWKRSIVKIERCNEIIRRKKKKIKRKKREKGGKDWKRGRKMVEGRNERGKRWEIEDEKLVEVEDKKCR